MELKGTPIYTPDKDTSPSNEMKETLGKVKQVLQPFWGEF
jgi:hypothetical protein